MPDSIGRYKFSEMARLIRDRLVATRKTVNSATGEELTVTITNQLFSNVDILAKLNSAMTGLYTDVMMRRPELFETDVGMDVSMNVNQYSFPLGMIQFSTLMWKPLGAGIPSASGVPIPRPSDYVEMIQVDDPHDFEEQVGRYTAPTFRRIGAQFQLNDIPQRDNPQGMMIRGVFLPPALQDDLATPSPQTQFTYIQGPMVLLTQEVIMLDAAEKISLEKMAQVPASLQQELLTWRLRVDTAIDNAQHPRSVQLTSSMLVQQTYSGRRRGSSWGRRH